MVCILCEGINQNDDEYIIWSKFCVKCRLIKHLISVYQGRVYQTLETVLVRNPQAQIIKEDQIIKEEIEKTKEYQIKLRERK